MIFVSFSGRIRTGRSDHNKSSQMPLVTSSSADEGRTHPAAPWVRAPKVRNTVVPSFGLNSNLLIKRRIWRHLAATSLVNTRWTPIGCLLVLSKTNGLLTSGRVFRRQEKTGDPNGISVHSYRRGRRNLCFIHESVVPSQPSPFCTRLYVCKLYRIGQV